MVRITFCLLLSLPALLLANVSYKVTFLGLEDRAALNATKAVSDLQNLQKRPPASSNALRYRIESDVPNMIKALRAFGYYDATITSEIENENELVKVYIFIHPGPQYSLESYEFYSKKCKEKLTVDECKNISLETIGIKLEAPAYARNILDSQRALLRKLANCGYPLAAITEENIIVDNIKKSVRVSLCLDIGPLCRFGPLTIVGLKEVETKYIARKVKWREGEIYNEDLVEMTQDQLIDTDLFSSVLISHQDEVDASGALPMKMQLSETKHKTISIGATYATLDGAGATLAWENRNLFRMGQYLGINLSVSRIYSAGIMTYSIPDFLRMHQYYVWQATASREHVTPYLARTYALENRIERSSGVAKDFSIGLRGEYIDVTRSIKNDTYTLIGMPFYFKYTNVQNILNPLEGFMISYYGIPHQAVSHKKITFLKQTLTGATYIPLHPSKRVILAMRTQFGSIVGTKLNNLPMNKRYFGGSDDELRGYKFKTVSPLNQDGNPTGGRGVIYFTTELRFQITEKIGIVPFFDIGNVTTHVYPDVRGKWYKSVGGGLRYFLFFGPLRLDVGFPLDRRKQGDTYIDPFYRIYISVGQAF